MMLKSPINATNTIKHTINSNSNNNNMSDDKVMIDLSNSKRIMMGGVVGVESDNSRMSSISTTIIPDPTPMKEDRKQVQQVQQQQQHPLSHRKSISTGDVVVVDTTKKRKMVRFTSNLPTKVTTAIPSMLFPTTTILTEEHCNELWYQKDELMEIKKEAKEVISRREENKNKNSNSNSNSNKNDNDNDNDTHDGLERFTRQRAIWKRSSIHYILLAQKQVKEKQGVLLNQDQQQEYLQNVSIRCSTWAKEAAFEQGLKDYCSIHDPLASLFASTTSTSSSSSDASTSRSASRSRRREDYPKDNNTKEEEEVGKGQEQEQEKRRQQQEQHYDELIFGTTTTSNNNNKDNDNNTKKTKKKMDCGNTSNNIHNKEKDRRPFKKRRVMMTIEV